VSDLARAAEDECSLAHAELAGYHSDIKREVGFRQRAETETAAVFARVPRAEAEKLERAAFELKTSKQSIIASLLRALDVDREEWAVGRHAFRPATSAEVLTLAQLAELLQLDERTVGELARKGEIPGRKVGREWRFSRDAVLDWLRGEQTAPRRRDRKQPTRKARE
jgi:excisionase family DNA binding protein